MQSSRIAGLVAVAGLAAVATAQDSVSNAGVAGINSDALSPYDNAEQVAQYIVDLAPIQSSWGNTFGIGVLAKASAGDTSLFETNLTGSHAISQDSINTTISGETYSLWNAVGAGVNPNFNDAGTDVVLNGAVVQQGFTLTNFGGPISNIIGGLVAIDPSEPARLYVTRANGAINGTTNTDNTAQMYTGGVDANGNAYFRADSGGPGGGGGIAGQNYFRTRYQDAANAGAIPLVDDTIVGTTGILDILVDSSGTTHSVPTAIPQSASSGNGLVAGPNFNAEYVYGADVMSISSTPTHRGSGNHRGGMSGTPVTPNGGAYTMAMLGRDLATGNNTESMQAWSINSAGDVLPGTQAVADLPATITDAATGVTISGDISESIHHEDQTPFRGGSQVAVHQDPVTGALMMAATFSLNGGGDNWPFNFVAVARQTAPGNNFEWTLAGYNYGDINTLMLAQKEILDGPGGTPIARMSSLDLVTGGDPDGPSISSPSFDSQGNLYFITAIESLDMGGQGTGFFDTALVKAVYDPATFTYELEQIVELGDTLSGLNSTLDYRITFLGIADDDSVDSGTFFANSANRERFLKGSSNVPQDAPQTLGGLVINASIIYDVDGDGEFDRTTVDERYNALLYVGATEEFVAPNPGCNPADIATPFGQLDLSDVQTFLIGFGGMDPVADIAGGTPSGPDGMFDLQDVQTFLINFGAGCPQ